MSVRTITRNKSVFKQVYLNIRKLCLNDDLSDGFVNSVEQPLKNIPNVDETVNAPSGTHYE